MNQIVRGDDDPTPPEGGTTRMPQTFSKKQTSGLRDKLIYFESNIERFKMG